MKHRLSAKIILGVLGFGVIALLIVPLVHFHLIKWGVRDLAQSIDPAMFAGLAAEEAHLIFKSYDSELHTSPSYECDRSDWPPFPKYASPGAICTTARTAARFGGTLQTLLFFDPSHRLVSWEFRDATPYP